jgi:spore germination cell wall hydrolase CwlJ-like protein
MWHVAAALAPLPLIGLGYASIPGNQLAYRMELLLSGSGSAHALHRDAAVSEHQPLPRAAAALFRSEGKGPRADQYLVVKTTTYADKQFISASASGGDGIAQGLDSRSELIRDKKSDRLNLPVTEVALRGGAENDPGRVSMFTEFASGTLQLAPAIAGGAPTAQAISYQPSQTGLNFKYKGESQAEFEERERRCLATAIYFEARGEPLQGQVAVGQVIMNRVRSPNFPETICGVVYQGQMAPGCQFSFTCDGKTDTPKNDSHWALAQKLAKQITSGQVWLPEIGYSTFYHADYVSPHWKSAMNKIDSIGRHIFYKKRNEKPYIVEEASAAPAPSSAKVTAGTFSLASTTPAAIPVSATPALSLGAAPSE